MNLALFGGTFDPIHQAHLAAAREAVDFCRLDRVLIVPAANPPHKLMRETEAYEHRYRMAELACANEPGFEVSELEKGIERSYTIRTIETVRLQLQRPDRLFFLIGADAFADLDSWHRWQDVIASVEFIVVSRPGHSFAQPRGAAIHRLESLAMNVSSSEIRRKLVRGEQPEELPPAVFNYIREHSLYSFGALDAMQRSGGIGR